MGTVSLPARILGIDPGPSTSKGLAIFDPEDEESHFHKVRAEAAREWAQAERQRCAALGRPLVIGWDAPLGVDFAFSYTQRRIEKYLVSGEFTKQFGDLLGPAVAVQGYGGCSHWTLSLDMFGRPAPDHIVPTPDDRLPLLAPTAPFDRSGVVETHPALALALCWPKGHVPKYKGRTTEEVRRPAQRENVKKICAFLATRAHAHFGVVWEALPADADSDNDYLDAQVSYLCVAAALHGRALLLGDLTRGGFAVPATETARQVQGGYLLYEDKLRQAAKKRRMRASASLNRTSDAKQATKKVMR
jgi:Protein of unknown function (DUF429)